MPHDELPRLQPGMCLADLDDVDVDAPLEPDRDARASDLARRGHLRALGVVGAARPTNLRALRAANDQGDSLDGLRARGRST